MSRLPSQSSGSGMNGAATENSIGGAATGETGAGTLRNAEALGLRRLVTLGRRRHGRRVFWHVRRRAAEHDVGPFRFQPGGCGPVQRAHQLPGPAVGRRGESSGFVVPEDTAIVEESFSCCCGQPMCKKAVDQGFRRAAQA